MKKTTLSAITVIALIILTISSISLPLSRAADDDWTATFRVVDKYTGAGIEGMTLYFTSYYGSRVSFDASGVAVVSYTFSGAEKPWTYMTISSNSEFSQGTVDPSQSSNLIEVYPACELTGNVLNSAGQYLTGFDTKVTDKDGVVLLGLGGSYGWQVDIIYGRWLDVLPLTVTISKDGFVSESFTIDAQARLIQHDFTLKPTGGVSEDWTSTFRVVDKYTGQGITGMSIRFTSSTGSQFTFDASNGATVSFDFTAANSPWSFITLCANYEFVEGNVDPSQSSNLIEVYPACELTGNVLNSAGQYLTGFDTKVTDKDGVVLLGLGGSYGWQVDIIYGRWLDVLPLTVTISKDGFVSESFTIDAQARLIQHDFTLKPTGGVSEDWTSTFRVVDKYTGQGITGMSIRFTSSTGSQFTFDASNGATVSFDFTAANSPWSFITLCANYEFVEGNVDPSQSSNLIEVYPACELTGNVLNSAGQYLTGFDTKVTDKDGVVLLGLGGSYGWQVDIIYGRWLDVLPLTVTISKDGFVSESFTIDAQARLIQHDFTLRSTPQAYTVHFDYTGSDVAPIVSYSINDGSSVSVNAPFDIRVPAGLSLTYLYPNIVTSGSAGIQYVLTSSNPSSPITINGDVTVTGSYESARYKVTYEANVPVSLPADEWVVSGQPATGVFLAPQYNGAGDTKYVFLNDNRPLTITAPTVVTGNYQTLYQVTYAANVAGLAVPNSEWVVSGQPATGVFLAPQYNGAGDTKYVLQSDNRPATITASTRVTATYKTQWKVTFAQSGVGMDFTGTVVVVDGTNNLKVSDLSKDYWFDDGSTHSYAFQSPLVGTSMAYVWGSTSGLLKAQSSSNLKVTTAGNVIGNYLSSVKAFKQYVFDQLTVLRGTVTDKQDGTKIDDAIKHLAKSLDPAFWVDGFHVDPKNGDKVFSEEKDAVVKLVELIKDKKSTISVTTLQGFVNRLVSADRTLASIAVNNAAVGGDAKKIAEANNELIKGDDSVRKVDFASAIEHYRNAWKDAIDAMKK